MSFLECYRGMPDEEPKARAERLLQKFGSKELVEFHINELRNQSFFIQFSKNYFIYLDKVESELNLLID